MKIHEDLIEKHSNQILELTDMYHSLDKSLALNRQDYDYMKNALEDIKTSIHDINSKLITLPMDVQKENVISTVKVVFRENWKPLIIGSCVVIFLMHEIGQQIVLHAQSVFKMFSSP